MNEDRILDKLDGIEGQNRTMLIALTRVQEQISSLPDHENRIRSLERWKYGLPMTAVTAVVAAAISGWSAMKGA